MEFKQAYELMEIERQCIERNMFNLCDRDCGKCDLVQKDTDLIEAFQMAKFALNKLIEEQEDLNMLDIMKAVDEQLQTVIDGTMEDNKKETDSETRRYGEGFCAGIELAQRYIRNADIKLYECYVDSEGYERCSHCNEHETGMRCFSFCPRCGVRLKH